MSRPLASIVVITVFVTVEITVTVSSQSLTSRTAF